MKSAKSLFWILFLSLLLSCKKDQKRLQPAMSEAGKEIPIEYASGLSITEFEHYIVLEVEKPWPKAEKSYRYLLAEENAAIPKGLKFDQRVQIPVKKIVVTSTTHIPSLETLGEEESLVGFPGLDYISSEKTRNLISQGKIRELGLNEKMNTENLLEIYPDAVITFSIDGSNKSLSTIEKSGIPVIFNSDWTESSPLGKAEWIKFFGAFYGKIPEAINAFEMVEKNYTEARELAKKAKNQPSVLAGSMFKDQWYLPAGNSWNATFFEDANANYLFKDVEGTGSLSLSFESVLAKAAQADFWVGPAQFTSYNEMENSSPHYSQFKAFRNKNVFTFSSQKGETGGVIFYELAPNRPDLVLKDLISIFHPELLPDYKTTFYEPLAE